MSGLAAIFRFDGADADPAHVAAMTSAMAWRGPDGVSHHVAGSAAFGHCAFDACAAGSAADQPLCNGPHLLLFDGYLSNYKELRAELLARGAKLPTCTDAELALHACAIWPDDFAHRLEGEFALILWDARRREAVCVRDHHGLRPLYWHWDGRALVVASEIAALLAALPAAPELNLGYLAEIAADESYTAAETVWQGVYRLLPAHTMRVKADGPQLREYWTLPTEVDILYQREEDYCDHYRALLTECVQRASRSHLPLAVEVSGGLDSSAIFALAHGLLTDGRLAAPDLRGYTLAGPPGTAADELGHARAVAAHSDAAIAEYPLFLPPLDWFAQRASAECDLPPLPNAAMSLTLDEAAVADGCRVSLNGIGGDQWLDGTHFYYRELFDARQWRQFFACYRQDIRAGGLLPATALAARLGPGSLIPARWRQALRKWNEPQATEAYWLQPPLRRELAERRARNAAQFPADYPAAYKLHKLRHANWSVVLDQAVRQRARSGLEMRSPMLSRAFIEFSARSPEHLRLSSGVSKHLHRSAMTGVLPASVVAREDKAEFSAAYAHLSDQLAIQCVAERGPLHDRVFDPAGLVRLFEAYRDTPIDERYNGEIWGVYAAMLMVKHAG